MEHIPVKSIPSRYTGLPFGAYAYGCAISVAKNHFGVITMVTPRCYLWSRRKKLAQREYISYIFEDGSFVKLLGYIENRQCSNWYSGNMKRPD